MKPQEIVDKIWKHFIIDKGVRSVDEDGDCLYRAPNGGKCGVGCLIPDELFDKQTNLREWYNGGTVNSLLRTYPDIEKLLGEENSNLLTHLQGVHDDSKNWEDGDEENSKNVKLMKEPLIKVIEMFKLEIPKD